MSPLERIRWVYEDPSNDGLSEGCKALLVYVAWRGTCTASDETVASALGVSRRSILRRWQQLDSKLTTTSRPGYPSERRLRCDNLSQVGVTSSQVGCDNEGVTSSHKHEEHPSITHPDEIPSPSKRRARARKNGVAASPSRWVEVWNGIAHTVPGLSRVRVFDSSSERSLLDRAAALGLTPERLEHELMVALPKISEKAKGWVKLCWLATGQKGGLGKLLNGDYDGDFDSNGHDDDAPVVLTAMGDLRHAR